MSTIASQYLNELLLVFKVVQNYDREKLLLILLLRSTDFHYIPEGEDLSSFTNSFTCLLRAYYVSETVLDTMDRMINKEWFLIS